MPCECSADVVIDDAGSEAVLAVEGGHGAQGLLVEAKPFLEAPPLFVEDGEIVARVGNGFGSFSESG